VRRSRRLVVSFITTVGNYHYGFYWNFYQDASIQVEVKLLGIVQTRSVEEGETAKHGTRIARNLVATYHQHIFSFRLDAEVDGWENTVVQNDAYAVPVGPDNPYGNAFTRHATRIARESMGARTADSSVGRFWQVVNPSRVNRSGQPVGYALHPQGTPVLLADESASVARRAAFATRHLWVTRYHPDERYPAGDLVNQHPGGAGLPAYVAADRNLDGADIVLWHTFGLTHLPRPEDWPVMPVDACGFALRPVGFFDRNPTLDVPPTSPPDFSRSCGCAGDKSH
jgi:primary-amine oxidase